jgi:hypothetical protein
MIIEGNSSQSMGLLYDNPPAETKPKPDIADALCRGKSVTEEAPDDQEKGCVFGGITPESSGTRSPKLVCSGKNPTSRINARPIASPGDQRHLDYMTKFGPRHL